MQEKKATISLANLTEKEIAKLNGGNMGLSHSSTNLPLPVYVPMSINGGATFTGRVNLLLNEDEEIIGHSEVGLVNFNRFLMTVPVDKTDEQVKEMVAKFRNQPPPKGKDKLSYEGFVPTIQAPSIKGMQEQVLINQRYVLKKSADTRVLSTTFTAAGKPVAADASVKPGAIYSVYQLEKSNNLADKIVNYLNDYYSGEWEADIRKIYGE